MQLRSGASVVSRLLAEMPAVHGDASDWRLEAHEFAPVVGAAASVALAEAASVALHVAASADACRSGDVPKSACKRTNTNNIKRAASASETAPVSAAASASAATWPACPALKVVRGKKALRLGHAQYKLGLRLGEGSFGTVYQATYQGEELVVKQLMVSSFDFRFTREAAWEEACVLDRCGATRTSTSSWTST